MNHSNIFWVGVLRRGYIDLVPQKCIEFDKPFGTLIDYLIHLFAFNLEVGQPIFSNGDAQCCDLVNNVERVVVPAVVGGDNKLRKYIVRVMAFELVNSEQQVGVADDCAESRWSQRMDGVRVKNKAAKSFLT